ncbi:sensor histidine kinase [Paenibacillus glycinis]|uniref:histidine kinase n=1 Tax=Paenibacillus glycinis TaxID=2697035 RepID=A0ABW9XKI9_9BACL|nr:HAMP domain-containing sensor histidine kinase [Paenibacillus glycinis]NBD23122.1 sensor histidine kinase [Paenibacillus glycinis]
MKLKRISFVVITMLCMLTSLPNFVFGAPSINAENSRISWQLRWEEASDRSETPDQAVSAGNWKLLNKEDPMLSKPDNIDSAWIRLKLPELKDNEGIFLPYVYGQNVTVFLGGKIVFHTEREHSFDLNRVLIPLKEVDSGKEFFLHLESKIDRLGINGEINIADYQELVRSYAKMDLLDIILGSAYIFVAFVMLVCSVFLGRNQLKIWLSLCFIILPIGGLLIGYSPFLYTFYGQYGFLYQSIFDISLYLFLPSLIIFFELLFGGGYRNIVTYFRRFRIAYSLLCILALVINRATDNQFHTAYRFLSVNISGTIMMLQFILMLMILIRKLWQRNIDSIILSIGLAVFASTCVSELILFYASSQTYTLSWWKWGLTAFVLSLIVLLGRRFAYQHKLIISYSRDLEIYNSELQRSEKMEIISQLAASVAHEVRNPLQVTRGLLQLLDERHEVKEGSENYYQLAINELDRASTIITDFLTFAKPQMEHVNELNLADEFKHVEGIIVPLANLQGGRLEISVPRSLKIMGNSSKLKQAIINIIKNSIEALEGSGVVRIWAYEEREQVVIHIADSGSGMDERILERLGEPYFSNKTKGTGLGLMVTFRIIEVMQGTLEFKSQKGIGTEAMIRFPASRFVNQTNAKVSV